MLLNNQLNSIIFKKQHKRLLDESLLDVRQKNASNLSDEQFKEIMNYDPIISQIDNLDDTLMASTNESYSRWLLKMFKNGSLQNTEPEQVRKLLQDFEIAKKRRNLLPNNDINSYKSLNDLQNALNNISQNLTINQKNKDARKAQSVIKKELKPGMYLNGGAELLFINDNWEVWTPHTYEGSKALRHGASWCTGGDTPSFYNSYTEEGQLFVFFDRKNPENKYQLFVPYTDYDARHEREFRDKNNNSLSFREFANEDSELLEFLMTQDNITNSYESLDDPDMDDEWDDDKEDEVMYQYDLSYDDYTGEIRMAIEYAQLVNRTHYTSYYDYNDMASHSYLEDGIQGDYQLYMSDVIAEESFVDEVDWDETDLLYLYKFFKKDSGLTEYTFREFLRTLFLGAAEYTESKDYIEEIGQWFDNRKHDWLSSVFNAINSYYLDEPYANFIYNALQQKGWNVPRDNNRYGGYSRSQSYMDQFKYSFQYTFDDCHSVQQFWEEYTERGEKSVDDIIEEYGIEINEDKGDIDTADSDWSSYSSEYAAENASEIIDVFMTKQEWNEFLTSLDNNEETSDEEMYNGIRCAITDNYYVFHDEGSLFYVPKKEIERNASYYMKWGELNLGGLPSEIIREQIMNYPTPHIKKILMKYGDLDDTLKRHLEKVDDSQQINQEYVDYHLSSFIENTIKNYIKQHFNYKEKEIDESLFQPDW